MRCYSQLKLIASITLALSLVGCGSAQKPAVTTSKIPAFKQVQKRPSNRIRLIAIKNTARSVGAQAGLAWRAQQINAMLDKQSRFLSQIYNFQEMLLANNVMPPVLSESVNELNLDNNSTIRLADRTYNIVKPARFVTTIPSWRDYLWMSYSPPEKPDSSLLPKTNHERNIWNKYVAKGWNEGIEQAQQIFTINMNRLHRDYQGMILYRKLLAQNIVSAPFVSRADLGITGGGNNLRINDRVLRITAIAKLRANSNLWRSRLHGPQVFKPSLPPLKSSKIKHRKKVYRKHKKLKLPKRKYTRKHTQHKINTKKIKAYG